MKTPRSQMAPVLARLTLKPDVSGKRLGREIAAYLLDENRTGELDSLLRDLIADRADKGVVEITAISAHKLSAAVREDIRKQVRKHYPNVKRIIVNERLDTTTIGGVRLELVGRQLDLTVRAKLNRFIALTTTERTIS